MKKLLFALALGALAVSVVNAGWCGTRNNCRRSCAPRTSCAPRSCAPRACAPRRAVCVEPQAPDCYKTIEVPVTITEKRCIKVPAVKTVTPQADVEIRECVAPTEVKIPLPQEYRIEYRANPDKITYEKQPDIVSYHCPSDCDTGRPNCPLVCN